MINSDFLKAAAIKKGIRNPRQLSQASGLHYPVCYHLWRGDQIDIRTSSLARLAKTLGVKINALIAEDEPATARAS